MDSSIDDKSLQRLRSAFAQGSGDAVGQDGCPSAEELWDAVSVQSSPAKRREVVLHIAECRSCAQLWRLAAQLVEDEARPGESQDRALVVPFPKTSESGAADSAPSKKIRRRLWRWLPAAAAIVLAAGLLGVGDLLRTSTQSLLRGEDDAPTLMALPPQKPLARDDCRLQWRLLPNQDDVRYSLRVTTVDFQVIAEAEDLQDPEYLIREESLQALPSGAQLFCRVIATLENGEQLTTAFAVSLE